MSESAFKTLLLFLLVSSGNCFFTMQFSDWDPQKMSTELHEQRDSSLASIGQRIEDVKLEGLKTDNLLACDAYGGTDLKDEGSGMKVDRAEQGQGDVTRLNSARECETENDYEQLFFALMPGNMRVVRRENIILTVESADKLDKSGICSPGHLSNINRIAGKLQLEQAKTKASSENLTTNKPLAGNSYQADLCLKFEQDVYLRDVFQGHIASPDHVKSVASSNNECFNNVLVKRGEYICFEITKPSNQALTKIHQLSRLYSQEGLKDDFIGRGATIAAFGLIVNGNRQKFEETAEKVRKFFVEAAKDREISKKLIDQRIPFFLCYFRYRNVHSEILDLRGSIKGMEQNVHNIGSRMVKLESGIENIGSRMVKLESGIENIGSRMTIMTIITGIMVSLPSLLAFIRRMPL